MPSHVSGSAGRWNALIRTHHITSRKKIATLRRAALDHGVFALLRFGGAPGIMYVEGTEAGVRAWVAAAQRLRYKDYHLAVRPSALALEHSSVAGTASAGPPIGLEESETVKDFAAQMQRRGVLRWWRRGMGYSDESAGKP